MLRIFPLMSGILTVVLLQMVSGNAMAAEQTLRPSLENQEEVAHPDDKVASFEWTENVFDVQQNQQRRGVLRRTLGWMAWPKVEWTRNEIFPNLRDPDRPRFLGQNRATLFERLANTRQRVGNQTREAWNRSLNLFKSGDQVSTKSRPKKRESWFTRMFQSDQIEPEGPLTINEWMSQDRIEP